MPVTVRLEPALAFVREKGETGDRALLKVLLGDPLSDAELTALTEAQNPDGGFRVRQLQTRLSVVGRTAETLTYFAALGAGEFGAAQAAADFLIEVQRPDGTWGENEALRAASPPPYFAPGSADVTGWETAAAVVALAGMGLPLDYRPALEHLRKHRVEGAARTFRIEGVLLLAAFAKVEGSGSPTAQRLRAEVDLLRAGDLAVFELNWGLLALHAAGLPAADPLVRAFGEALAGQQRADGGWGSGPDSSAYETVLALCALEHAGLVDFPRAAPLPSAEEPDPAQSDHGI